MSARWPNEFEQGRSGRAGRLQSLGLVDRSKAADLLPHADHAARRRDELFETEPQRRPGLHHQDHGGGRSLARREHRRHDEAADRSPGEEARRDPLARPARQLHAPGRDGDHGEPARRCAGRHRPRRLVPGAQEDGRYRRDPPQRGPGSVLRRRVRRHLWPDLRVHGRGILGSGVARLPRGRACGIAAHPEHRQGAAPGRAGGTDRRRILPQPAGRLRAGRAGGAEGPERSERCQPRRNSAPGGRQDRSARERQLRLRGEPTDHDAAGERPVRAAD
ncbi:hypothetical protein D9M69_384140 [compost metagenome]